MEMEEERRARLENDAATKRLSFAMETDEESKARLEKMVMGCRLSQNSLQISSHNNILDHI